MQRNLWKCLILGLLGGFVGRETALSAPPLWEQLAPRKRVATDPASDYTLTENQGPWLVFAASFSDSAGEAQARDLVLELRQKYNLPAWYYGMTFDLDNPIPGRGLDQYGGRIKRRYQRGDRVLQHAVLVGEFPSVNDPEAQKLLARIKRLRPETLASGEGKQTSQSLATVREFHRYLKTKMGGDPAKGPMSHAFMARNPLLPKEYFVPSNIDSEVVKWNKDVEFSLMKCPGTYSIRVATFKGRTSLKAANTPGGTRQKGLSNALVVAAENAHRLTVALREKGWEAYEFHDRRESFVTIGSFDQTAERPDGRIVIQDRDAQIIIDTFGAMKPNNLFNRPAFEDQLLEKKQKERFQSLIAGTNAQVAGGFHPKKFVGLPFDIHPAPVKVPRQSISSAYVRN